MSTMSTTSRSPGSAPSIANGPLSMWHGSMFMSRMSSASSLLRTWSSVQSLHSIRYVEPGATVAAGGMSGCQRLWPGTVWSRIDALRSRLISKMTSGTGAPRGRRGRWRWTGDSEAGAGHASAGIDPGRAGRRRRDVDVEDRGRDVDRGAGVRDVHDPGQPALDRCRAQDHVGLLGGVAELRQVVDRVQAGPLVGQVRVQVALLVVQGHRRPGEGQPPLVPGVDVARHEDRILADPVGLHAPLDQVDVQVDEPAHLDGPAEGDLAVALGEVQVAHGQLRAGHEDRVEDPAALGQVLDVLVPAVLPRRRRARGLTGDPV